MVTNMNIRTAELRDLQALTDIYNYEILNGTATFDLAAVTPEERRPWFDSHNRDNHPLIVADDENGVIHGYASLSPYSQKKAYDPSVELSVYIAPDSRRMGIGAMLMKEILDIASKDGITHTVISLITSENSASIKLHEKFGFKPCGKLDEAGIKFGRYLDVSFYILHINQK